MTDSGWFGDPTGRFAQRWYDGANWTGSVVAANGSVIADPVPEREEPFPPPAAQSAQHAMQQAAQQPGWGSSQVTPRQRIGRANPDSPAIARPPIPLLIRRPRHRRGPHPASVC